MSSASFTPAHRPPAPGASALGAGPAHHQRILHALGNALRAIRVYAEAAFRVVVLGEYAERSPVIRR
ncbi:MULTISPECIES: hypothetical protein [unclassified Streptomyces]|uniref:hypothetical protein n=1 Tax=unclassified Streptomyces TaxID=2593676 RepID=UPI003FD147C5